jgi:hypothetical protein
MFETAAGDILVFLTGQAEIDKAVKQLNDAVRSLPREACGDLLVRPIYAALPPEMQVSASLLHGIQFAALRRMPFVAGLAGFSRLASPGAALLHWLP